VFVSDGSGADDADPHASYCDMARALSEASAL
jgi:hypothetical protein